MIPRGIRIHYRSWRAFVAITGYDEHQFGYILYYRRGRLAGTGPIYGNEKQELYRAAEMTLSQMSLANRLRAYLFYLFHNDYNG